MNDWKKCRKKPIVVEYREVDHEWFDSDDSEQQYPDKGYPRVVAELIVSRLDWVNNSSEEKVIE